MKCALDVHYTSYEMHTNCTRNCTRNALTNYDLRMVTCVLSGVLLNGGCGLFGGRGGLFDDCALLQDTVDCCNLAALTLDHGALICAPASRRIVLGFK